MQVSGIVIEIDGKKYAIDMDKARELHNELNNLFGSTVQHVPWHIEPWRPSLWQEHQPYPYNPITYCDSTDVQNSSTSGSFLYENKEGAQANIFYNNEQVNGQLCVSLSSVEIANG